MLLVHVSPQKLEHLASRYAHTIVQLYSLLPEVDRCSRPVCVAVVDRDEDDVLREDGLERQVLDQNGNSARVVAVIRRRRSQRTLQPARIPCCTFGLYWRTNVLRHAARGTSLGVVQTAASVHPSSQRPSRYARAQADGGGCRRWAQSPPALMGRAAEDGSFDALVNIAHGGRACGLCSDFPTAGCH